MKIEVKDLVNDNEMLSHIFLGCIPHEQLEQIRNEFIGKKDWSKESVKIPVDLKIGGVSVNPKSFFDEWQNQMRNMINKKAQEIVSDKLGSSKIRNLQAKLNEYENILNSWEDEINWEIENPLL